MDGAFGCRKRLGETKAIGEDADIVPSCAIDSLTEEKAQQLEVN